MNARDFFTTLNEARIPYVVVYGFRGLPENSPSGILLLTTQKNTIVNMGRLVKLDGNRYKLPFDNEPDEPGLTIELVVKGNGRWPDRFEAEMLSNAEIHNTLIKVPPHDVRAFAYLYEDLYRNDLFHGDWEKRSVLTRVVSDRVGPPTPYEGLPCHSK